MQLLVAAALTAVLFAAVIDKAAAKTNKEWQDEIEKALKERWQEEIKKALKERRISEVTGKDPASMAPAERRKYEEDRRQVVIDVIEKVVKAQIDERAKHCTKNKVALFYAGGTGAGKQFAADIVMKTVPEIKERHEDPNCDFVILNHDSYLVFIDEHVKPEFPQCFAPGSGPILGVGSGLVKRLLDHAIEKGVNFAWDGTLNGLKNAKAFRDQMPHYKIHVIAVDADPIIAAERTFSRAASAATRAGKDAKLQATAAGQKVKHREEGAFAALCQVWLSYATFRNVWQTILEEFGKDEIKDNQGKVTGYKNIHFFKNHVNGDNPKRADDMVMSFTDDLHMHPAWFEFKLAQKNGPLLDEYLRWNGQCNICGANTANLANFYAKVGREIKPGDENKVRFSLTATPEEKLERVRSSMELDTKLLVFGSYCYDHDEFKSTCDAATALVCLAKPDQGQRENWKKCPRTCGTCYTYIPSQDGRYATAERKKKELENNKETLPTNWANSS